MLLSKDRLCSKFFDQKKIAGPTLRILVAKSISKIYPHFIANSDHVAHLECDFDSWKVSVQICEHSFAMESNFQSWGWSIFLRLQTIKLINSNCTALNHKDGGEIIELATSMRKTSSNSPKDATCKLFTAVHSKSQEKGIGTRFKNSTSRDPQFFLSRTRRNWFCTRRTNNTITLKL